jgi:hypothetical protein
MLPDDVHNAFDLRLPGYFRFSMVQMTGIVSDFIHERSGNFGESIIFLQVHRKVGSGALSDFLEGFGIVQCVNGNADESGTGIGEALTRFGSFFDIGRLRCRHTLQYDGQTAADPDRADGNDTSGHFVKENYTGNGLKMHFVNFVSFVVKFNHREHKEKKGDCFP